MFSVSDGQVQAVRAEVPAWETALPFPGGQAAVLAGAEAMRLLAAPYSSTGDSALFLVALGPNRVRKIPLDDEGAEAIVPGPDGRVYLGTRRGRLLRVDPAAETVEEQGRVDSRITAGVWHDGACWFATDTALLALTPDGTLTALPHPLGPVRALLAPAGALLAVGDAAALRRADGATAIVPHPVPHPRAAALPDGGVLLVSAQDGRAARLSADLAAHEALPALPDGDGAFCLGRAGDALLACAVTGALYRLIPDGWEYRSTPMPYDPFTFAALPDGRLAGVTYQGRLVQTTPDWSMAALAPLPTGVAEGMTLSALGLGADRRLYFAPCATARVGRWDPEEDALREPQVVSPFPGQVDAFGVAGERLYLATGDPCAVLCYYPDLPARLLENPKLVGKVGPGRPVGTMSYLLGHLYFAVAGADEGALVRILPIQDRLTVHPGVVPGQQPTGMVVDRFNHWLLVGGRSATRPAAVACWCPDAEAIGMLAVPFPDAHAVRVWAAEGGRAYVTDGGDRLAILQTTDGAVLECGRFPLGAITAMLTSPHGECYGLAGGWLFHFDPVRGRVERLTRADGDHLTLLRRDYFAYTRGGRIDTVRLW